MLVSAPVLLIGLLAPWLAVAGAPAGPAPPAEALLPSRGLVIVLRPKDVDETTRIALARVMGELTAARFRVVVMPLDPSREPSREVESVALDANAVAAFAIARVAEHDGGTIAIWVCDRVGRRTTIQRMAVGGDNLRQDAEVLALEAIELIRDSISGLWSPPPRGLASPPPSPPPPAPSTAETSPPLPARTPASTPAPTAALATAVATPTDAPAVTPPAPEPVTPPALTVSRRPELTLALGVAALLDGGAQSTQWMGVLTAMVRWSRGFAVRASLAGLGPTVVLSGTGGTAALDRVLAALGAAWFLSPGGPADFYLSLALGVAHVDVTGATTDPAREGRQDSAWLPTGSAGLGTQLRLGQRISVGAAAELVWAWSRLDVLIDPTRTGALMRPAGLVTLGLQASF